MFVAIQSSLKCTYNYCADVSICHFKFPQNIKLPTQYSIVQSVCQASDST